MKTSLIVCILCLTLHNSLGQKIQSHSGIDSLVRIIQKTDDCSISYDSSTFKNGNGAITCFFQNKANQKLTRVKETTNIRARNKKITRNYYFNNDNLIKVETEESSDCCGNESKAFYYTNDSDLPDNASEKGSQFYLNLSKVIQKSFYKKYHR